MQRYRWIALGVLFLLLTACGSPETEGTPTPTPEPTPTQTAEPTPSGPLVYTDWSKLEPYQPKTAIYTRRYEDFTDTLIPADDYGPLMSFAGAALTETWEGYNADYNLYGLVTLKGEVVVDPVFTNAFYLEERDEWGNLIDRPNVMLLGKVFYDEEGYPEERYALCAGDGSWCTDFLYEYSWENYRNTSFSRGILAVRLDGTLAILDQSSGEELRVLDLASQAGREDVFLNDYMMDPKTGWVTTSLYYWDENGDGVNITLLFDPEGAPHPLPPEIEWAYQYGDGLVPAAVKRDRGATTDYLYGYVDVLAGTWAIEPAYTQAGTFENGVAPVVDGSSIYLINTAGERLTHSYTVSVSYPELPTCSGGYWYITEDYATIIAVLNEDLEPVDSPLQDSVSHTFLPDGWIYGKTKTDNILARGEEVYYFPLDLGEITNVSGDRVLLLSGPWRNDHNAVITVADLEGNVIVRLENYVYGSLMTDSVTGEGYLDAYAYTEDGDHSWDDLYDLEGNLLVGKVFYGYLQGGLICLSQNDCTTFTDREGNVVFRWPIHSAMD